MLKLKYMPATIDGKCGYCLQDTLHFDHEEFDFHGSRQYVIGMYECDECHQFCEYGLEYLEDQTNDSK